MAADRELKLNLVADVASATASVKKLDRTMTTFGGSVRAIGADIGKRFNAMAIDMGVAAVKGAFDFLQTGIQDAIALQGAMDQLGLAMRRAGSAMPTDKLGEWIGSMELATNISDVDLTKAMQGLVEQFGSVRESQRILALATEVAAAKGIDLSAAIRLVTGAYYGSARAARVLGTEGRKGWNAIGEAEDRFAGSNKKRMATIEGRWATVNTRLGEIGQAVGELFLGPLEEASRVLVDELVPHLDTFATFIKEDVSAALEEFSAKMGPLLAGLQSLADGLNAAGVAGGVLDLAFGPFMDALTTLSDAVTKAGQLAEDVMAGDLPAAFETGLGLVTDLLVGGVKLALAPLIIGIEGIGKLFDLLPEDVRDAIGDMLTELGAGIARLGAEAERIGKAIYDGIVGWIQDIADTVSTMVNDVLAELQRLLAGGEGNVSALRDKWLPQPGEQSFAPPAVPGTSGAGATSISISVDGGFGSERAVLRALRSAGRVNGGVRLSRVRPVRVR